MNLFLAWYAGGTDSTEAANALGQGDVNVSFLLKAAWHDLGDAMWLPELIQLIMLHLDTADDSLEC